MSVDDRAREAINQAERRDPGNPFVASCRRYFEARGFLSAAQIGALRRVTRTHGRPAVYAVAGPATGGGLVHPDDDDPHEAHAAGRITHEDLSDAIHDAEWGGNTQSWDWAGGD